MTGITLCIAVVLTSLGVLAVVAAMGTSRSLSTRGRPRAHLAHRDTPLSPCIAQDTPKHVWTHLGTPPHGRLGTGPCRRGEGRENASQ